MSILSSVRTFTAFEKVTYRKSRILSVLSLVPEGGGSVLSPGDEKGEVLLRI